MDWKLFVQVVILMVLTTLLYMAATSNGKGED